MIPEPNLDTWHTFRRRVETGLITNISAKRATGLVPREHLGRPIGGPRFVASRLSLKDREDRLGRFARGRVRRVDLEHERKAGDRLLQDHVNRLRIDVLADFL